MNINELIKTATVLPLIAMLALHGCGGGGGSTTSMTGGGMTGGGTGGGTGTGGGAAPLTPATGLTPSSATPQIAMSAGDTLAARLPDATNEFAPLTSVMKRNFNRPQSAAIGDDAYIKSIASDGANGFHVAYVVGDEEQTVHFAASDYGAGTATQYFKEADGRRYWLSSFTGSFSGAQKNLGPGEFRHFDANVFTVHIDRINRSNYVTYGVRTDPDALPEGTAHYSGSVRADVFGSDAPSINDRTRVWASLRLTIEFAEGSVAGDIRRFRMQEPGQSTVTLPLTVYADIADGRIVDGRFTAKWTQVVPDLDAGEIFAGDMLGEFYGANAEEVGGVLNATNDTEVLAGWFGGRRPTPSVPAGSLTALSAVSHQDLVNSTTVASDAAVSAIAGDGAGGFDLTYVIGSDTHRVQFGADDFGGDPRFTTTYLKQVGDRRFYFWDGSRSFTGNPEFSHFNIGGWTVTNVDSADAPTDFYHAHIVYGAATEASSMPAGTANYAGRMFAYRQPPDTAGSASRGSLSGDLMLSANFDQGTVGGSVDDLRYRPPGGSWGSARAQSWTIENGSIAGNALSADVTAAGVFDGDMEGRFFGPDAEEVGGTIKGTGLSDNAVVYGYFGGTRQ